MLFNIFRFRLNIQIEHLDLDLFNTSTHLEQLHEKHRKCEKSVAELVRSAPQSHFITFIRVNGVNDSERVK